VNKNDELIQRALAAEDRELLARHAEPGYFSQAIGLFRGSLGWVAMVSYLTAVLAFVGFGVAMWQCWVATDAVVAVRWGVLAAVLFQLSAMSKTFLGSHLEANRLLREIKRVELQLALVRSERDDA
jgi:hypothetical protein